MNKNTRAITMVLLMMASVLAGCTGGDPDGDDNSGIDMEILNQMIDDNLQDFINNTSSDSVMNMFTVSWDPYNDLDWNQLIEMETSWNQNSDGTHDESLLFSEEYNNNIIEFRYTCSEFTRYAQYSESAWEAWLIDNYGYDGAQIDDVTYSIWWKLNYGITGLADECHISNWAGEYYPDDIFFILFEIELEVGQAASFQVIPSNVIVDLNCEDGYGTGLGNGTATTYIGGQSNCTITGSSNIGWEYRNTNQEIEDQYGSNIDGWELRLQTAPHNFAVYFTMHNVEVYDLNG